jgi:hypothetical protein
MGYSHFGCDPFLLCGNLSNYCPSFLGDDTCWVPELLAGDLSGVVLISDAVGLSRAVPQD